ncbi:MAG TPA: Crp/Fnr family transcriptional regulator [Acidobacteriota bacterium]|nr:Crp/Fnr family transcriptional regulator [Acidobacteriota bacterium]
MSQIVDGGAKFAAERRDVLARLPFLAEATPEVRKRFLSEGTIVRLSAGDYFLQEGDVCASFAVVLSGRMRVFKLGEGGQEITLYHVGGGEACPLNVSCILSDRPVPATARVEEDVEALVIPARTFRRWVAEYEPLQTFVFRMFTERLTEVMSLVEEVAFKKMDQRLAGYLDDQFHREGEPDGVVEITHAQIASELGTAREVVSRLLKEFERLGAVELSRGRISLRKEALLRSLAARGEA